MGCILVPITSLIYKRINARRDVEQKELDERGIKFTEDELRKMGDRAPDFRYTL